ncbi:MAG: hypothetical protein EOO46_12845 [Flavobacterium sp.]|nr:MAG: hypothetical protein EOO46_12845 [Flavobacterium sp.]
MNKLLVVSLLIICNTCAKQTKDEVVNDNVDFLSRERDTTYTQILLNVHQKGEVMEELQLYASNKKDTILNQYKLFRNGVLDTAQSRYYILSIGRTKRPNVYQGTITVNSYINKLILSKGEEFDFEFSYWQVTKDSTYLTTHKAKQKNKIRFKYTNIVDDNLSGIILINSRNDTVENGEEMVRLRSLQMLVDNKEKTNNVFLNAFNFYKDNRFEYKKMYP